MAKNKYSLNFGKKVLNCAAQTYPVRDKILVKNKIRLHALVPLGTKCDERSTYFVPTGTTSRNEHLFSTNILSLTGQMLSGRKHVSTNIMSLTGQTFSERKYVFTNMMSLTGQTYQTHLCSGQMCQLHFYPVRDKILVENKIRLHTLVPLGTKCDERSTYFVPTGRTSKKEHLFSTNILSLTGQNQ